jgi:2-haloacid dehalogenase
MSIVVRINIWLRIYVNMSIFCVLVLMPKKLDPSRIRVITFDCYGTLINWETGILNALRPILNAHKVELPDLELLRLYGEIEAEVESGEFAPYREVLCRVVSGFGSRLGFVPTQAEQQSLPESLADWVPFPDTINALHQLKTRFKLGIISNVDDDLFAATARRLQTDFDYVITAGQARAYKPSKKIFELAKQRLGAEPGSWLHAGQSIYHDVIPAKSIGIATAWVNRPSIRPGAGAAKQASGVPDIQVASLQELRNVLAGA